jgi:hypothetical protein
MRLTSLIGNKDLTLDRNSDGPRGMTRHGIFATFLFAATLAFAPLPAFAQHGGGGGGGGGSHGGGGGGGGGSHASGGGSHATGSSAGSGSGSAHAPASNAGASGGNAGTSANHWWNPFHGSSTASSAQPGTNGSASGDHTNAERFAAGNNSWQEPPARGMRGTTTPGAGNNVRGAATNPRAAVSGPPHIPVIPRRPIVFAPFFPFYPGFGFGFGGLYYGAFGPCDPFWGCYGYGYGYNGMGYGYYGGGFSSGYGADLSYSGAEDNSPSEDMTQSSDTIPSLLAQSPDTSQEQEAANPGPATRPVTAVLYLKDGSSYAVTDYWLTDGKIHYITSYGGENSIDQSALDLQRTVNENAAQGMTFTLRPASGATNPQ